MQARSKANEEKVPDKDEELSTRQNNPARNPPESQAFGHTQVLDNHTQGLMEEQLKDEESYAFSVSSETEKK